MAIEEIYIQGANDRVMKLNEKCIIDMKNKPYYFCGYCGATYCSLHWNECKCINCKNDLTPLVEIINK